MLDRLLAHLLNGVVLGLIASAAMASVVSGYTGLTLLVRAHPAPAGALLATAVLTGLATAGLIRHREDLSYS